VRAPLSGVLSSIEVGEGTQLNRGQLVAVVTDPARLKISVEVPALDIKSIRAGMSGEFRQQGRDKPLSVKVKGISSIVDPATGTAPCELVVDTKDAPAIFAGVLGRVILKANERMGFLIPEHAVLFRGASPFVRVIESGKAKRLAVKLGSRLRGSVEVLEGLSEGAILIERSNKFVSDGEEVTVEAAKAEGA
jgi:membrane fusion protein (multidrug efflux system)